MAKLKLCLSILMVLALTIGSTSCSKTDDDYNQVTLTLNSTDIKYGENNVWADVFVANTNLQSQSIWFAHSATPEYNMWSGWSPSRNSDLEDYTESASWLKHQWTAMTGGGMSGKGTPYMVGFWSSFDDTETTKSTEIKYGTKGALFTPQSMYITNTTYAYNAMTQGIFCKVFEEGDYFLLNIYGVTKEGTVTTPIKVYLTDYRSSNKEEWVMLKEWTFVNLEPLGKVSSIYFTMESSDSGKYGMNNPAYFAMDRLKIIL